MTLKIIDSPLQQLINFFCSLNETKEFFVGVIFNEPIEGHDDALHVRN